MRVEIARQFWEATFGYTEGVKTSWKYRERGSGAVDCPGTTHFLKIDFDRFFGVSWVRLCQVVTDFQFTFYIKSKQNVCVIPVQWATLTVLDSRNQWECVSELNDTTFHNTLMYTQLLSYNRRHSNFDHQKMLAPSSFSRPRGPDNRFSYNVLWFC